MQAIPENISIRMLNGMLKRLVTATLSAALHPGRLPVGGCIAVGGDIKIIKSVSIFQHLLLIMGLQILIIGVPLCSKFGGPYSVIAPV
jgi:hypothetical protein